MAQVGEAAGYDGFFRADHRRAMGGSGEPGPTDAWTTLTAPAVQTERIRLGTLVTSTFRLPGPRHVHGGAGPGKWRYSW